ncbi:MAG: carboxylating nicotinate-nucleotide diphosphorylase [Syntrophobacterales bacterium]|jgi:nicotinate-nucleotide pyrophosphorylase (carboxylating)|nr:carboxylating nicotinate-nucleotide diphosphorylase [Syntrophobacterales bacterium]
MADLPYSPHLDRLIDLALEEDLGSGDVTTQALIPPELQGEAQIRAKQTLVVAGLMVAARVLARLDPALTFAPQVADGREVDAGQVLAVITGPVASILTGERTALNFLQRLSGIATFTRDMAAQLARATTVLVDTRKTAPGWRVLEKYAVRMGGGRNHRLGLYDGLLIKNNHIAAAGSITAAVRQAKARGHYLLKIEVEVADLPGLEEALAAGADLILLDNMDDATLKQAVDLTRGRAWLEASGSMTKERLPRVAATGVNAISMGALTHSAPAVDIHLRLVKTWR